MRSRGGKGKRRGRHQRCILSSGGTSTSGGGGSEGDGSARVLGSKAGGAAAPGAARAASREANAEKPSRGGSVGGSSTAPKGKGKRKAGQQEQTDGRGGRNKRRRSGGAGRNATKASATARASKKASGTGRVDKMPDEPKSRQEVWDAGFDYDEAAMDFEDACYESDVEAREELAQDEKEEREAWERERKGEREKEKQKQTSKTFHRTKTPSEKEGERFQKAPVQVFPGDTIPVDCIRSWGCNVGFHDKIRCGYCNAGTELKTSEEQKTERTDQELLIRKKRAEREGDGDGGK